MPLLLNVQSVRVDLPEEGEWVDVKSRLSKGDETRIQAAAITLQAAVSKASANDPHIGLTIELEAATFAGLEVGIVAWSFPQPVTPENIRALDSESYTVISERVNELWAGRSDNERRDLGSNGRTPSSGKGGRPKSLSGSR
ncbi:MAG: hypothetical protein ACR2NO_05665 [Chloroflexota bacterium]